MYTKHSCSFLICMLIVYFKHQYSAVEYQYWFMKWNIMIYRHTNIILHSYTAGFLLSCCVLWSQYEHSASSGLTKTISALAPLTRESVPGFKDLRNVALNALFYP